MILTQELIDKTVKSAKCCLAKKTFKFYGKLALAIRDECLYKEIQGLKRDIEILKKFSIIDEVKECCCTITGEYDFSEINDISPVESQIQFLEDGTGTLINPSGTYSITWSFLNNQLFIELSNGNLITYSDVTFNSACDINFQNQEQGYSFLATIDAPTDAQIYDGVYGEMKVLLEDGTTVLRYIDYIPVLSGGTPAQKIIPDTLSGSQEIADYWNAQLVESNLNIEYSSISEVFNMSTNYYNGYDYTDHVFQYIYCSDNGNPAYTTFVNSFSAPWTTNYTRAFGNLTIPNSQFFAGVAATMEFLINDVAMFGGGSSTQGFYYDGAEMYIHNGIYTDITDLVTDFNANNGLGFIMESIGGFNVRITAPNIYHQTDYNTKEILINYFNVIYPDDSGTFSGGTDQTSSNIVIQDAINGVVYNNPSPQNDNITTVQDLVDNFNLNNTAGLTALLTANNGTNSTVKITAPINTGWAYNTIALDYLYYATGYEFNSTYSNGVDTTTGKFIVTGTSPSTIYYEDLVSINYTGLQEFVDNFNNSTTNQGFTAEKIGAKDIKFTAPFETGADYNGELIYLAYNYDSVEYTDVNIDQELLNGVDPTFTTLEGLFAPSSVESSSYTNKYPCSTDKVELTCLSNEDVIKIIENICKECSTCK